MEYIGEGRHRVAVPTCWDELTSEQLHKLALLSSIGMPAQVLKVSFALSILGFSVRSRDDDGAYRMVCGRHRFTLTADEFAVLADKFSFIFTVQKNDYDEDVHVLSPSFLKDPYPSLRRFHGPGDGFENVTYEQFMHVQYQQSILDTDEGSLEMLIACLWHSHDVFDPAFLKRDAKRLRRLPVTQRQVMFWYYLSCMEFIHKRYPRIFSSGDGKVSGNVFEDQLRVVDALASGDMTKKPLVRSGYLYDALISMDESLRHQEEMESRMGRH